jgi:sigma-B regulation protein RsbU (phosphoserine phosphatase)
MARRLDHPAKDRLREGEAATDLVVTADDVLQSKILVVDDDRISCEILLNYLNDRGFQNIGFAFDGEMALEKIRELRPDLVVLDIEMPVMDGIQVLDILRKDSVFADLPVIVGSGHDTREERNRIMAAGATNFLVKPIDKDVFNHRIYEQVEKSLMMTRLQAYRRRVAQELSLARDMQEQLLPSQRDLDDIEADCGVTVDWHFQSSSEVGGDWIGLRKLEGGRFCIMLVDFSGHGVGAAINTFRLHAVIRNMSYDQFEPSSFLGDLNGQLSTMLPRGQFATIFIGCVDPAADTLFFSASGSTQPILRSASGEISRLDSSGIPAGITNQVHYESRSVPFREGDTLLLYSDAMIEEERPAMPPLDEEGLERLFNESELAANPTEALDQLITAFYQRYSGIPDDDLSVMRIERRS